MKTEQLSSFMLISLFNQEQKWIGILLMVLLPYIVKFLDNLKRYILSWYYPTTVTITIKQNVDKKGVPTENLSYIAMCWYITKKYVDKQRSLVCESNTVKKNEKIGKSYKKVPNYEPDGKTCITFDLNDKTNTIYISFTGVSEAKSVRLESTDMNILTEFISFANGEYMNNHFNDLDPDKIYVCEKQIPKYSNSPPEFEGHEMDVYKTYNNVYLPSKLLNDIKDDIKNFKSGEKFYKTNGIPYKRSYLLYGPPGTGKTSIAYAIARENKMNMYKLDLKSFISTLFTIKQVAQLIPPKSLVLIEEVDTHIYNDRGNTSTPSTIVFNEEKVEKEKNNDKSNVGKFPMSRLMEILDGYDTFHGCIIILTTNHKEFLDPALIRPGRVDMHYYLGPMGSEDIKETVKRFTGHEITVPSAISMTSSTLINQILLPHHGNKTKIQKLIRNFI